MQREKCVEHSNAVSLWNVFANEIIVFCFMLCEFFFALCFLEGERVKT